MVEVFVIYWEKFTATNNNIKLPTMKKKMIYYVLFFVILKKTQRLSFRYSLIIT